MIYLYWFLEFFISFIEAFTCFEFCDLFVISKNNTAEKILLSNFLAIFVIIFNNISLMSPILSIIMIILYWASQYYIRKSKPVKLIFSVICCFVIIFTFDYIFCLAISIISNTDIKYISENMSPVRVAVGLSSKTILFLFVSLLKNIVIKEKTQSKKADYIFAFSTFIITVISMIMYVNLIKNKGSYSTFFLLLCFSVLLVMILTIFIVLNYIRNEEDRKRELSLIEHQNNLLQKNLKEQEEVFLSWKKSIHDYKNKMMALEGMLKSQKYDEALHSIENELNTFKNKAFYISTGNITVDILLNNKMNIAKNFGIVFTFNVNIRNEIRISDINLATILGNLIDNAIEAVQKEENKNIYVQMNCINSKLIIKVINTFSKEYISEKTTKSNFYMHGIGLKSIRNIVDEYDGDFSLNLNNGYVVALIVL